MLLYKNTNNEHIAHTRETDFLKFKSRSYTTSKRNSDHVVAKRP